MALKRKEAFVDTIKKLLVDDSMKLPGKLVIFFAQGKKNLLHLNFLAHKKRV